jgi:hypothetical protein
MNSLKEHIFPLESFIGGWYIPEKLCDDIIRYFNTNIEDVNFGTTGFNKVDKNIKDSLDLCVSKNNSINPIFEYRNFLGLIIKLYEEKFLELKKQPSYNVNENFNIQYYKPDAGFKVWHSERSIPNTHKRLLVFMTYLNDVPKGGTEFKYQKIVTPANKGLTILWPSEWTHTHRGQIDKENEKYIITGWLSYNE